MKSLKILIAGTSSSYLEISKKMLKFHYENCEVDFARSGQECVSKAKDHRYDLILFDHALGDMNGLEVIDTLKTNDIETPLIMLVEEGEEDIALKSLDKGASDYILKVRGYLTALPFTVRNILERQKLIETNSSKQTKGGLAQTSDGREGYFVMDRRTRFLSANEQMVQITGYSEEELSELAFIDLLQKESEIKFYEWLHLVNTNGKNPPFRTEIFNKTGVKVYVQVELSPIKDENKEVIRYRGKAENISTQLLNRENLSGQIDQVNMVTEINEVVNACYHESLSVLLERLAEIACQIFRFKRSTIALLDRRKKAFVKQAMVGYASLPIVDNRTIEVPYEVIDRIFAERFRVKVIYYNQDHRDTASYLNSQLPERRTQKRRAPNEWHKRDLILVNLLDRRDKTFGYISLDDPSGDRIPTRDTFHNLEVFGQMVSFAIENYYQFADLEKRSRRLKQILVTSNIFKLYLSLNDLLREVVWSIKFSVNFDLVALGLISKKSGQLEIKAVACEDKIKAIQLSEINFPLKPLAQLLQQKYAIGKSYYINDREEIFRSFKQTYYGARLSEEGEGTWPNWGVILVPLKSKEGKIIGFLIVDDPHDQRIPTDEVVRTLEILANQVAVAIDNRVMYVQAKKRLQELESNGSSKTINEMPDYAAPGIKNLVDRFFK